MTEKPDGRLRLVLPTVGLAVLAVFCLLYRYDTEWYFRILTAAFPYPFEFPFLDGRYILAVRDCWQRGIDVYTENPCDPLHQLNNYSPLLLRLTFLPTDVAWTNWFGLGLAGAFLVSLAFLPAPGGVRALAVIGLATLSPTTAFVIERANIDLIVFLAAVVVALSLGGGFRTRAAGYSAILLAGLLKYYPFALLLLALRERWPRFLLIAGVTGAAMLAFGWYFHEELAKALGNIPTGLYFSNGFGAVELPGGVGEVLNAALSGLGVHGAFVAALPQSGLLRVGLRILLTAVSALLAARLASRAGLAAGVAALPAAHRNFLLVGAILISGCFFTGHNVGYRGIFLLFALPALLALTGDERLARMARWTAGAIVFNMWSPPLYHVFLWWWRRHPDSAAALSGRTIYWAAHEFIWWWMATVFLAVVFVFVAGAALWRTLPAAFSPVRGLSGSPGSHR